MIKPRLSIAWQILIGLILGVVLGALLKHFSAEKVWWVTNVLKPAGDIFILLIKMCVIPVVISSLIVCAAATGDAKRFVRIGFKTIVYFDLVTIVASLVGLVLANVFQPGAGINLNLYGAVGISRYMPSAIEMQHDHALNIFALTLRGAMLPIIFFSVLLGVGVSRLKPGLRVQLVNVFQTVSEAMFKVTHMIMSYAPIGVFALIAVTVANFGFTSLVPLAKLVALVYVAIAFFAFVVLGAIARIFGFSIIKLMGILKAELILAYSTGSSETVLTRIIEKMEAFGAPKALSSFVVPTGYSINLDGSMLYQGIVILFIAQLYDIDLSVGTQVMLIFTLMLTSKGIAGAPGASFMVLLATLNS